MVIMASGIARGRVCTTATATTTTTESRNMAVILQTRPQCSLNRALKLTVTHTVQLRFCYCFYLYLNVQLMKRDIVIAVIYCYITTDFHYAKGDSRLSPWWGVMLQRVGIKNNVNLHFSLNFS